MRTLADRIQHALDARGKKAADLARACGVRPPSVSDWLTGETKSLKAHTAIKAAAFLSVNIAWLTQGVGVSGLETPAQFDTMVAAPTKASEPAPLYAPWPFKQVTREAIDQLADHQLLDRLERTMVTRIAEILQDAGLHPDQAVRKPRGGVVAPARIYRPNFGRHPPQKHRDPQPGAEVVAIDGSWGLFADLG